MSPNIKSKLNNIYCKNIYKSSNKKKKKKLWLNMSSLWTNLIPPIKLLHINHFYFPVKFICTLHFQIHLTVLSEYLPLRLPGQQSGPYWRCLFVQWSLLPPRAILGIFAKTHDSWHLPLDCWVFWCTQNLRHQLWPERVRNYYRSPIFNMQGSLTINKWYRVIWRIRKAPIKITIPCITPIYSL